jgi:RNA polymerase sigma-70 factor (ECF subfamily)
MVHSPDEFSREIFTEFYRRTASSLRAFLFRTCGDAAQADDLLQESFLKFLRARPPDMDEYQRKMYLFKIGSRLVIDGWRRSDVEKRHLAEPEDKDCGPDREALVPDMQETFSRLKPRERTLLWLAYVEGYSHEEMADMTGLNAKSIRVLLFRGRATLAGLLREKGYCREDQP